MNLRDWFAGQALAAIWQIDQGNDWTHGGVGHNPAVARKAYAMADAMLAERARRNTLSLPDDQ
jgi:hypothetical protein